MTIPRRLRQNRLVGQNRLVEVLLVRQVLLRLVGYEHLVQRAGGGASGGGGAGSWLDRVGSWLDR
ncbi:MAG: hypothetical protein Q4G67_09210, partial [Actinomycetia bacterium]|nr:hypothetical protein [Actinomycetes bacterium]